ncbi:MAG: ATP-binding protein [Planctomycetota bacterium]|nr:ATP-binding protein [Planctomycetota bacterium]
MASNTKGPTSTATNQADASPTKEFFIYMLTRDIELIRAIIDLVDNCVDGARKLSGEDSYNRFSIRLEVDTKKFRISDNCGGIPFEIARDYAFRFGRPEAMPALKHSIGQFGVGMKRAFFKLGRRFEIDSRTNTSLFKMAVDVEEWKKMSEWKFGFSKIDLSYKLKSSEEAGTNILVAPLHDSVSEQFGLENFVTRLRHELADAHRENLAKGLTISVNNLPIESKILEFLQAKNLKPAHTSFKIKLKKKQPVKVDLYCGIGESRPAESGWYVFCNGRLVLGADQTIKTGWGEGGGRIIPKWHGQYSRFFGLIFFNCDDAGMLPWNTTKSGIDGDSSIYIAARLEMIKITRPVIDFLNDLDKEKDLEGEGEDMPLHFIVNSAKPVEYSDAKPASTFVFPSIERVERLGPRMGNISYKKPVDEIEKVKQSLKVYTNKEVGDRTFQYYLKMECSQ